MGAISLQRGSERSHPRYFNPINVQERSPKEAPLKAWDSTRRGVMLTLVMPLRLFRRRN